MSPPTPSSVAWLEWGPDAFERAHAEGKPVLLSISASWCHGCAVMDTVSYGDRRVAALIADDLVPVRVDADRRPDINDRYNLDGWPTTVLLTPSGEMLTGTTYLPADGLLAMLDEVTRAYQSGRDALDQRAEAMAAARRARPRALPLAVEPDLAAPDWLADVIVREVDAEYGGFGADGKFLHIAALTAGVRQHAQRPDARDWPTRWSRTLDAMAGGGIRDGIDGGFFRYAASREWMRPHTEKMLEDQVGMVRLFLEAAAGFDRPDWIDVARDTIAFVHQTLADPADGRFFASQAADEGFYQLPSAALRRTLHPAARGPHALHRLDRAGRLGVDPGGRAARRPGAVRVRRPRARPRRRRVLPPRRRAGALRGRARRHPRPAHRSGVRRARAARPARGDGQPDLVDDGRGADAHGDAHALG